MLAVFSYCCVLDKEQFFWPIYAEVQIRVNTPLILMYVWIAASLCLTFPQDMIHIADTKVARRYGDFFIRQIHKFEEVSSNLLCLLLGLEKVQNLYYFRHWRQFTYGMML